MMRRENLRLATSNWNSSDYPFGKHSLEERARITWKRTHSNLDAWVVEAETCEDGRLHFVRIHWMPYMNSFVRQYVWDEAH